MQVRALKTFQGRYGLIRRGQIFNAAPGYARDLKKNKLVEDTGPGPGETPAPGEDRDDKAVPEAPHKAGKESAGGKGQPTGSDTAAPSQDAGTAAPPSSSPAVPASPEKTLTSSKIGARRGTPTQRKKRLAVGKDTKPGA